MSEPFSVDSNELENGPVQIVSGRKPRSKLTHYMHVTFTRVRKPTLDYMYLVMACALAHFQVAAGDDDEEDQTYDCRDLISKKISLP